MQRFRRGYLHNQLTGGMLPLPVVVSCQHLRGPGQETAGQDPPDPQSTAPPQGHHTMGGAY